MAAPHVAIGQDQPQPTGERAGYIEYYGRPVPLEFDDDDTPISELVQMANERFGLLPTYHTHIQFVPLEPGGKRPAKGFVPKRHPTTNTRASINLLVSDYQDSELGIGSRGAVGALTVIDNDHLVGGEDVRQRYERETGNKWPLTYTTQTRPQSAPWKMNFHFKTTAHSLATLKKQVTHLGQITGFDLKGNGGWGYVRAEGNVRNGERVTVLHDFPILDMPDELADWIAATNAKADSQNRRLAKQEKRARQKRARDVDQPKRAAAVAADDRWWTLCSRARTFKNLGMDDDQVMAQLRVIMLHMDGGDQLLQDAAYIRKLRVMVHKIPTIGVEASLRNVTRHRRERRRRSITLAAVKELFKRCPPEIAASESRRFFSVQTPADHERLRRQFLEHGYVALGRQGSHDRVWTLRPSPPSLPIKKPSSSSSSYSSERGAAARGEPQHQKVNMRKTAAASGGESAACRESVYETLTHTGNASLIHTRRKNGVGSITLAAVRERFLACPLDISPADARVYFSVRNRADHERLRREFRRHGYIYIGSQGSHSGIWSRPATHSARLDVQRPAAQRRTEAA